MLATNNPTALRSQKELIDALISLMKETPYSEISVKQILLESKLSRKTFYRNFNDKNDLLNAYLDTLLNEYSLNLRENNDYIFTNIMHVISSFILKNKDTLKLFWENDLEYLILKKLNNFILTLHYTIAINPPRIEDYIVMLNNGAIWNVINEWMRTDMKDPLDEILKELQQYLKNIESYDLAHPCNSQENKEKDRN